MYELGKKTNNDISWDQEKVRRPEGSITCFLESSLQFCCCWNGETVRKGLVKFRSSSSITKTNPDRLPRVGITFSPTVIHMKCPPPSLTLSRRHFFLLFSYFPDRDIEIKLFYIRFKRYN